MIIKKEITIAKQIDTALVCDKCKRTIDGTKDIWEFQEAIRIYHSCGYGSIFGDENTIKAEFCQQCAKEIIGPYLRTEEEE